MGEKMTEAQRNLPPKELCRCKTFCLEDTSATGRVCRTEYDESIARAALTAALSLSGWRTIDSAPKDDPIGTVYQRLLWRHMEAARKDFDGEDRKRLYTLVNDFKREFKAECDAWEAQFAPPATDGKGEV